MSIILSLNDITMNFGGLKAIDNVSTEINKGEIRAIIGPNGAGKTTLLNIISGYYKPTTGKLLFEDVDITGKPTYKISNLGIARTYQNIRLFKELTVLENIMIGKHYHLKQNIIDTIFYTRRFRDEEKQAKEQAQVYMKMIGMADKQNEIVKNLSYGQQKVLEIARALAQAPKILLLDEPAAGLNDKETENIGYLVTQIRDMGITILLIEHNMTLVMGIAEKITVLNFGEKIAEDTPTGIRNNKEVIKAYLGKGD